MYDILYRRQWRTSRLVRWLSWKMDWSILSKGIKQNTCNFSGIQITMDWKLLTSFKLTMDSYAIFCDLIKLVQFFFVCVWKSVFRLLCMDKCAQFIPTSHRFVLLLDPFSFRLISFWCSSYDALDVFLIPGPLLSPLRWCHREDRVVFILCRSRAMGRKTLRGLLWLLCLPLSVSLSPCLLACVCVCLCVCLCGVSVCLPMCMWVCCTVCVMEKVP